jgi:hypothetical protein
MHDVSLELSTEGEGEWRDWKRFWRQQFFFRALLSARFDISVEV